MNVLIVEDQFFVALDLADIAEGLGFSVLGPCVSASEALATAADRRPAIALVDVNLLDGPTGPVIAAELAASFGTAVIMVTANPEGVVAGENGVTSVLRKPFSSAQIEEALSGAATMPRNQGLVEPSGNVSGNPLGTA